MVAKCIVCPTCHTKIVRERKKRAPNKYNLFIREERKKPEYAGLGPKEAMRKAALVWNTLKAAPVAK